MFPHFTLLSNYLTMKTKYIKFCKRCNTETEHYACGNCINCTKELHKKYYNENKDKIKERLRDYYDNNKELIQKRTRNYYNEHKEKRKEWIDKNKEDIKDYQKKYNIEHRVYHRNYNRKYRTEHPELKESHKVHMKKYNKIDLNNNGITKVSIRNRSKYILHIKRNHSKLENYEIHHCFGYDDPNKFVYIPKYLHLEIHQRLRDLNISADSNHYNVIVDLINSCQQYTYISI